MQAPSLTLKRAEDISQVSEISRYQVITLKNEKKFDSISDKSRSDGVVKKEHQISGQAGN